MSASAMALYPRLLLRAREPCGQRADVDAEDLVGIALLAMVAKPPEPKTPAQLNHWLRPMLRKTNARRLHDMHGYEFPASWDAIAELQTRGGGD